MAENNALRLFKKKTEKALKAIENDRATFKQDPMVEYVFKVGEYLFTNELDKYTPDALLRMGGKLSGAFPYLGQLASYARAERDVYEQKLDEVEKELTLAYLDSDYKVTEAKAKVTAEVGELKDLVNFKEHSKNQHENVLDACEKLVSFLQSAIKVKEGERFAGSRLQNNN